MKRILLALVTVFLASCGTNPIVTDGGSATDVGCLKGNIVKSDNTPAGRTLVLLVPSAFNPVTGIKDSAIASDTTDTAGSYFFNGVKTGRYSVQALQLDDHSRLLVTGQQVLKNDTATVKTAALSAPGAAIVFIADTLRAGPGHVYIPGTTFSIVADSSIVIIDSLPAALMPLFVYASDAAPGAPRNIAGNVLVTSGDTAISATYRVLYVNKADTLNNRDSLFLRRLAGRGIAMISRFAGTVSAVDTAGIALVFFGSSIDSGVTAGMLRVWAKPVLAGESSLFGVMTLTGPKNGIDYGVTSASYDSVAIVSPAHPLAAGLSGTVAVLGQPLQLRWGMPATAATIIASVPGMTDEAMDFCFDKGTPLYDTTPAPARRVGLFLELDASLNLNANGWRLFDAAVNWCLEGK
ncbi:MAG TPA: hypothetical protein VLX68_09415 [Chitinivibrionales bacterium]|nr:hypothetical protein [Chitinivibrionales bacterium]